jgi:hypothetical protein
MRQLSNYLGTELLLNRQFIFFILAKSAEYTIEGCQMPLGNQRETLEFYVRNS